MVKQEQALWYCCVTDLRFSSCQNTTASRLRRCFWRTAVHQPQHPSGERLSAPAEYTADPKDKSLTVVCYFHKLFFTRLCPWSTAHAKRSQTPFQTPLPRPISPPSKGTEQGKKSYF